MAIIFVVSLLGVGGANALGFSWLPGFLFVASCIVTIVWVRSSDVLGLVVAPPLAYFLALLIAEVISALSSKGIAQAVAIGLAYNLASTAPWLIAGTLLSLIIGCFRGLPGNVRRLRAELRGDRYDDDDELDDEDYYPREPRRRDDPRLERTRVEPRRTTRDDRVARTPPRGRPRSDSDPYVRRTEGTRRAARRRDEPGGYPY